MNISAARRVSAAMAGTRTTSLILAAALCGAAGCYARPPLASNQPVSDTLSNYRIGETMTVKRGDIMVDRTEGAYVLQGFTLTREIGVVGTDRQPQMDSGIWSARFQYHGPCEDGAYVVTNPYFYEERVGIIVTEDGSITCNMPVVQLVGGQTGRSWQLDEPLPVYNVFRPTPFVAGIDPEGLRWQLIYRGRSGRSATVEYRELREDMDDYAQPSFVQTIKHDVGPGRKLSFRGTEVEIVRASDRDVTFRVMRDEIPADSREGRVEAGGAPYGDATPRQEYFGPESPPARGQYGPY